MAALKAAAWLTVVTTGQQELLGPRGHQASLQLAAEAGQTVLQAPQVAAVDDEGQL